VKLATWNVNSIRAREGRLLAWLREHQPDVVCLQETKVVDEAFPTAPLAELGYASAIWGQPSYNGVAILSREPLLAVERGLGDDDPDDHARLIAATTFGLRVVCAYVPNGSTVGSDKYAYKLRWLGRLRAYFATRARPEEAWVFCGDLNVAPDDRDVHDPAAWAGQVLCSTPEREALAAAVGWGLADTFRHHHAEGGHYSWWDYRGVAFFKNHGLRIDHVYATPSVLARSRGCVIDRAQRKGTLPSDHAPVIVELGEPTA